MGKNAYYYDLSLREMAALFLQKDWKYGKKWAPVEPEDLHAMVRSLVNTLDRNGGGYAELGRFVVYRDAEFPNSYEVMLKVGYVNCNVPDDMDASSE